jgi:sulfite exporter TauE/SafE
MLWTAVILGLLSSLHCVGMCGPIALMLPLDRHNPARKVLQIIFYHLGKSTTYALLGLVFGLAGRGLFLAGMQQKFSILMGAVMIAIVLMGAAAERFGAKLMPLQGLARIKASLGKSLGQSSFNALFTVGMLNGLLPCAMVYSALFGALAMQAAPLGGLYMLLFGLGTLPLMASVHYLGAFIPNAVRRHANKIIPIGGLIVGSLFILRGLGLGLPMLSPQTFDLIVKAVPACHQ